MATKRSSSTPSPSGAPGVHSQPVAPFLASGGEPPDIEVRVSNRRKKSAVAFFEQGKIVIVVPARLSPAARDELVERLTRRVLKRRSDGAASSDRALHERAERLAGRYFGDVRPASVRWVTNQRSRWASCTPSTGEIRVSHRLAIVPDWVLDAVLVHELAHLIEPSHSRTFRSLERRYPRQADAEVFLAGYQLGMGASPLDPRHRPSGAPEEYAQGSLDGLGSLAGLGSLDDDLEPHLSSGPG
jgi:predicted metal-dependent hydrolase